MNRIIVSLLILIFVSGCGMQKLEVPQNLNSIEVDHSTATSPLEKQNEKESTKDTIKWVTYINDQFGFTFDYPDNLGKVIFSEFKPQLHFEENCELNGSILRIRFENAPDTLDFSARTILYNDCAPRGPALYDMVELEGAKNISCETMYSKYNQPIYYGIKLYGDECGTSAITKFTKNGFAAFTFSASLEKQFNPLGITEGTFKEIIKTFKQIN